MFCDRSDNRGLHITRPHSLSADLVVIEIYIKRALDVCRRAAGPNEEVVRTDLHHFEILCLEELLDDLDLCRARSEACRDLLALEPVAVIGRCRIV
jgi:hypothetical protein